MRNTGRAEPAQKLDRIDWYMRKEWFMTHLLSMVEEDLNTDKDKLQADTAR